MAAFYKVKPEVAGSLGDTTELDTSTHPPIVSKLEYEFAGWLGSHLIESFPCYIASTALVEAMTAAGLSGFVTDEVTVTLSPEALGVTADMLPPFVWFKPTGMPEQDDIGVLPPARLVVSEAAKQVMEPFTRDTDYIPI